MAINLCDSLLANDIQGFDCDNPMIKGVENIGVLINRSDINLASVTKDAATHEITALPLASGKKGYQIVARDGGWHLPKHHHKHVPVCYPQ